ncbi:MAG: 50S ribosomal protein L11 [Candidatus Berkelbacteria bacterium]|nr:MAG: 50S ribosomal protein L11 [Candidatus Berkelbacteria bacterium]QQG51453.1 MAG: 50S ribosomal protein L11 [Candidatus Berkelbacteria bacterium]
MAKKLKTIVKLQVPAGRATPAPPVGTALGPHGVNLMEFVNQFNEQTRAMGDTVVPVELSIYEDRSFTFITKTPPAANQLLKAAGLQKGSQTPKKEKVGKVSRAQIREIAENKMADLNARTTEQAERIIEGTARSMGIEVEK